MTKPEVMRKLLALGELEFDEMRRVTGWKFDDVADALEDLRAQQAVTWRNNGAGYRLWRLSPKQPNPFQGATHED